MHENAYDGSVRSTGREALLVVAYVVVLIGFSAAWKNMTPPATSVVELAADAAAKRAAAHEIDFQ